MGPGGRVADLLTFSEIAPERSTRSLSGTRHESIAHKPVTLAVKALSVWAPFPVHITCAFAVVEPTAM